MEFKAPAKINLFLNIGKKREDSFHELLTIMVKVSFFDRIEIEEAGEIEIDAPEWIPLKDNLVNKAARLFFKETGIKKGCRIRLKKNIPPGAGLGGGSSDAAATLKALNRIFNTDLPTEKLEEMGAKLGSDINFFLHKGGCLASGRGDRITPLSLHKKTDYTILLIDPSLNISTKKIYKNYPEGRLTQNKDLDNIIKKYENMDWPLILRNDLEETVFKLYPSLKELKVRLENRGLYPLLSGSGSFMFALSNDRGLMESASETVRSSLGFKTHIVSIFAGESPNGKAPPFGGGICRFESCLPSQAFSRR